MQPLRGTTHKSTLRLVMGMVASRRSSNPGTGRNNTDFTTRSKIIMINAHKRNALKGRGQGKVVIQSCCCFGDGYAFTTVHRTPRR